MKLFLVLFLVAAATADLGRINLQANENDGNDVASNAVLIRHVRTPPGLARGFLSFMTQRFANKHVANAGDMSFRHLRGKVWETNFERFALQKARNGYRRDDMPIRDALPDRLSIIETSAADREKLAEEFQNRDTTSTKFITDNDFKVHTLTKNGNKYNFEGTSQEKVELGVDSNGHVNHLAGTVKCRNNGRQSRHARSVFRLNGRLCVRTWRNPSQPDSSLTDGSSEEAGVDNSQTGQTRPQRPCRRGFRRVAGRCVRQRQRQTG